MNKEMSRKGKHREEKTMLAAYISPDIKALAMLTQAVLDYIENIKEAK